MRWDWYRGHTMGRGDEMSKMTDKQLRYLLQINPVNWTLVPNDVRCKTCRVKGLIPDCSRCEGTGRKPIPNAEVMRGRIGNG